MVEETHGSLKKLSLSVWLMGWQVPCGTEVSGIDYTCRCGARVSLPSRQRAPPRPEGVHKQPGHTVHTVVEPIYAKRLKTEALCKQMAIPVTQIVCSAILSRCSKPVSCDTQNLESLHACALFNEKLMMERVMQHLSGSSKGHLFLHLANLVYVHILFNFFLFHCK